MKRKIFPIIIVFFALSACSDYLDQQPITELTTAEIFSDPDRIADLLPNAYQPMKWEFVQRGDSYSMPHIYTDVRSDDVVLESYFFQPHSHGFETFVDLDATNINVDGVWFKLFSGVGRANELIRGLAQVDDAVLDANLKAQFVAEAKFLRGYYYFELVKNFGDVPLFGVEPVDAANAEQVKRKPQADVYAQIEQDFIDAGGILPTVQDEKYKATKGAALGLLSKVYLYQEKWQQAADAAQSVIDLGIYELEEDFGDNWELLNEHGKESLFEIDYNDNPFFGAFTRQAGGSLAAQFMSPNLAAPITGWNYNLPTPELQQAFIDEGDVIRRKASILMEGDSIGSPILQAAGVDPIPAGFYSEPGAINDPAGTRYGDGLAYSRKYFITPEEVEEYAVGFQLSPLNQKVMRYAEVLLILAEATLNGASGDGQGAFDQVRARVNLPSKTLTYDALKLERRLEFVTEWNRFHDLVRWGDAAMELEGFTEGRDELLPIPFNEIQLTGKDASGADILTQNEGY